MTSRCRWFALARFIGAGAKVCEYLLTSVRINPFRYLADGNIHSNLTPPDGRPPPVARQKSPLRR
jgi:hypothetical protein